MARPFWKGYLKLSLVTCPVALTPAVSQSERIRFHTLNAKTGNRVRSRYADAVTGKPVEDDEQVMGYEVGADEHVMLEDEELDAVALETTHTIDIEKFVPKTSVDPLWLDSAHYMTPNGEVGEEAFSVIRDAMESTDMVGLSRLVLYRRERAVLTEARHPGIILWTLRQKEEIRDAKIYFGGIKEAEPAKDALKLAKSVIAERTVAWDPSLLNDPVQENLAAMIRAKRKGVKPRKVKQEAPAEDGKVVNIMDALKRSIERDGKAAKRK